MFSNKLRDLELAVKTAKDTKMLLEALEDNFMIKTVRLVTAKASQKTDEATDQLIENFQNSRVGTEIRVNSNNPKFKKTKTSSIEVFYPDSF